MINQAETTVDVAMFTPGSQSPRSQRIVLTINCQRVDPTNHTDWGNKPQQLRDRNRYGLQLFISPHRCHPEAMQCNGGSGCLSVSNEPLSQCCRRRTYRYLFTLLSIEFSPPAISHIFWPGAREISLEELLIALPPSSALRRNRVEFIKSLQSPFWLYIRDDDDDDSQPKPLHRRSGGQ